MCPYTWVIFQNSVTYFELDENKANYVINLCIIILLSIHTQTQTHTQPCKSFNASSNVRKQRLYNAYKIYAALSLFE